MCLAQAASSKPQQNGFQQSAGDAHLPATGSKGLSTKGKQPAVLEADTQPVARRLPRLRRATHTDTDTQLKKREGQHEQAGPSHKAAVPSVDQQQQQQQRRSLRQTPKAEGRQHMLDPPAAGGVHMKAHPKQGVHTSLTAGKGKSKGKRPAASGPEQKAEGFKQVVGDLKKGKKTADSRWEPVELQIPFALSAKGGKATSSKGKPKGPLAHAVSLGKAKNHVGVKQQATAFAESAAQEAKAVPDAKQEPGPTPPQCGSTTQAEQLTTDALHSPLGLGKGKRKRTATKHMEEDSKGDEPASSKHQGMDGKVKEEHTHRCARLDIILWL